MEKVKLKKVLSITKKEAPVATVSVSFLSDVQTIIEASKNRAYAAINIAMLERNWLLGKRIAEEEINGKKRADYGVKIIAE